jgi:hypothetical protein
MGRPSQPARPRLAWELPRTHEESAVGRRRGRQGRLGARGLGPPNLVQPQPRRFALATRILDDVKNDAITLNYGDSAFYRREATRWPQTGQVMECAVTGIPKFKLRITGAALQKRVGQPGPPLPNCGISILDGGAIFQEAAMDRARSLPRIIPILCGAGLLFAAGVQPASAQAYYACPPGYYAVPNGCVPSGYVYEPPYYYGPSYYGYYGFVPFGFVGGFHDGFRHRGFDHRGFDHRGFGHGGFGHGGGHGGGHR